MSAAAGKKGFPLDVRISFLPLYLIFFTRLIISETGIKINTLPKIFGGFYENQGLCRDKKREFRLGFHENEEPCFFWGHAASAHQFGHA